MRCRPRRTSGSAKAAAFDSMRSTRFTPEAREILAQTLRLQFRPSRIIGLVGTAHLVVAFGRPFCGSSSAVERDLAKVEVACSIHVSRSKISRRHRMVMVGGIRWKPGTKFHGTNFQCGPMAQLGARIHGMDEVVGSKPTRSTNLVRGGWSRGQAVAARPKGSAASCRSLERQCPARPGRPRLSAKFSGAR
jgi:hypothetical protein